MKNALSIGLLIIIVAGLSVLIDRLFFVETFDLEAEKARVQSQIDSLNAKIQQRDDSLKVIGERLAGYQSELASLQVKIDRKDKQIHYYEEKGRFDYDLPPDSLHRELNDIIKQRLRLAGSPADSLSR